MTDELLLDSFRDRLRDGVVRVHFHGTAGEPLRGILELQEDKVTLVWRNSHRFPRFQQRQASVNLRDVRSVREGRQTTNFIRTIKYVDTAELPQNDDRCLSLCAPSAPSSSSESDAARLVDIPAMQTFDIEFEDMKTRNIARSFFLVEASLSGTIDLCEADEIPLPRGLATRCYQLFIHPSFELLVFVSVVSNMLFIALKPFIVDDDQSIVTTKPKMTENMSPTEVILLILLTIEQLAKVIGLEGLRPLLRRKWDAFDFAVVWISWLAMIPSSSLSGFNMLSLRLFRCARMFKNWKGFHEIVETFLAALPMAGNAVLCYCYYLFLFAILGMYLFNDSLSHRCAVPVPSTLPNNGLVTALSTQIINGKEYVASFPGRFCRMDQAATDCKAPLECIAMHPPNNGYTGFHSFQASFTTVFLISLRSGFGTALDGALQASSYFSIIYFIGLMVFVSYMILSLFVGIVRGSYIAVTIHHAAKHDERAQQLQNYLKKQRIPFPLGTDIFPDVVQFVLDRWRGYRVQATDTVLQSPLFTRETDPDDAFLSRFRLRQHRMFYILEPGSAIMDKISMICESVFFEHFMNLVVFGNTILFAFEYHGMSKEYAARLYGIENFLVFVYAAEFVIICANAGGLFNYLKNPWNRLDFIILSAAFVEYFCLAASLFLYSERYARAIFVLRIFRVVRPFRIVRNKNEMVQVLDAVLASVPAFLSLCTFHVFMNSVFAVVGMNLFGGKFPVTMRSHFNTFGDSMLTLFKISCGGNTWQIFYASLQASSFGIALSYYMAYFILCVFVLLNFMLVVLLRNFAMKEDERKKTLSDIFQERMLVMQRIHHFDEYTFLQQFSDLYQSDIMYATLAGSAEKRAKIELTAAEEIKSRLLRVLPTSDFLKIKGHSRSNTNAIRANGVKYQRIDGSSSPPHSRQNHQSSTEENNSPRAEVDDEGSGAGYSSNIPRSYLRGFFSGDWITSDVSLFLFPPHSRFRLKCKRLEKETDKFIFSGIVMRTILLTVQSPEYSSLIQEFTTLCDIAFVLLLLFEFTIKVVSRGFAFTPQSYLSNRFNQLNMVALMACSLLLLLPHSTMVTLFSLSRAFGPIRVFYRVKTFRVITQAVKQSAKQIFYCVVITMFLFYSFATIGMQFFAGKFSFCNDPSVTSRLQCEGFFWSTKNGILMPRVWGNLAGMHFDNIVGAMGSVFVLVSKKGWLPVLNLAMDIVDGDHQPVQNASAYFALFFVLFIFFARFYLLKVFAGIIMNNFRCYNGTLLLTNLQLIWMHNKQSILALRPKYPLPRNKMLQKAQVFVQTRRFRLFSSCTVILHTILLAWYRSPIGREIMEDPNDDSSNNSPGVWWCHYVFSMIYALDAIMCVVSIGWKDFLMKGFTWRTTNSFTAFIMLVGPLISNSPVLLVLGMTRAFDFKHISLVFERLHSIKTVFETLLCSVRLTLKVTLLLGYVVFVFATVSMQLFSRTRWNYGLDSNINYATFPNAFSAFVKFTAGEDWYDTYIASSVGPPKCTAAGVFTLKTQRHPSDCGSAYLSSLFYNIFYILVFLVLQNLYVATMVDTFVSTSAVGENKDESIKLLGFKSDDLKLFQTIWSEFDTNALGYMHKKHLLPFLTKLDGPLGLGSHQDMLHTLMSEDTPPSATPALAAVVHRKRRETFHEIEARISELTYRLRLIQDHDLGPDLTCP
uniref:EF-hand domain-containing protein n=1 Tax=Globisporangium ultimum (strain ATCC 200006 / CBS 805.95 / DAOM BR144) TaxID=431595 RepID=K3WD21_GLOUD